MDEFFDEFCKVCNKALVLNKMEQEEFIGVKVISTNNTKTTFSAESLDVCVCLECSEKISAAFCKRSV